MLVVYKFKKEEYLKSQYSNIEINVPYGTLVGYDEEESTLYYNDDKLNYSTENFVQDILTCNTEEMEYSEYLEKYKDLMSKLHADAPVLNQPTKPSEFDPQNPFQRLIDAGLKFSIR